MELSRTNLVCISHDLFVPGLCIATYSCIRLSIMVGKANRKATGVESE